MCKVIVGPLEVAQVARACQIRAQAAVNFFGASPIHVIDPVKQRIKGNEIRLRVFVVLVIIRHSAAKADVDLTRSFGM